MRRHGRTETLLLYYFRTPPFVKVGRAAIDDEAMARLEQQYPDITFEWDKILREPPQTLTEREAARRKDQREAREARRKRKRPVEVETEAVPPEEPGAAVQEGLELEAQDDYEEDSPAEPDVITSDRPVPSPVPAAGDSVPPVEGVHKRRRRRRRRGKKREGEPGSNPPPGEPTGDA